jgi:hypothetical protein
LIAIAAAIFAACIILRAAVGAVARSISDIAIVLSNGQHMPVLRETRALLAATTPLTVRSFAHARRLFSRPPPALS